MTESVAECRQRMVDHLETLDAAATDRIGSPSLGDVVRQGDIYLTCIESLPTDGKPSQERQLAPGTSQGSRHTVQGDANIVTGVRFQGMNSVLVGPAFECKSDVTVAHPEHGDRVLPEGTTWQVTYQQAYADEVRRVQD